jgi:uncharacterized protein
MWSRLTRAGMAELLDFLLPREAGCVGFTGRMLKNGKPRLPNPALGGVFVEREEKVESAVLLGEYGVLYPIFGSQRSAKRDIKLARFIAARCPNPATLLGKPEDFIYLAELLEIRPAAQNEYYTMTIGSASEAGLFETPFRGIKLRKALPSDAARLFPLQEAYELEEVITPVHRFNPAASRLTLEKALKRMTILVCEDGGEIVAKAGTNALGFAYDQVGGIYVKKEYRGRGIGTFISSNLVGELLRKGRKVSLFVKKTNTAAIAAYKKVGFRILDSFRIGYFV